ncbi:MAG: LptF/LptG family permease [Paludibacteraceae bacterium]|nr:LptF/LptG family permease [Paludibacteraceae bacterium]
MFKRIDFYIIKKFLGTYFLCLLLIIAVAIIIDLTEKMDDFYDSDLGIWDIIRMYYIHFVPYYMNMLSSIFTLIAVIFVTSKMANNSEIIAMLAGGISFRRILVPYLFSATVITVLNFYIGSFIIPPGTVQRVAFEAQYVDHEEVENEVDHQEIRVRPNQIVYMQRYEKRMQRGYHFSIDTFDGKTLKERTTAARIEYDSAFIWTAKNYTTRRFVGMREEVEKGDELTMDIALEPADLVVIEQHHEQLTTPELKAYIDRGTKRGLSGLNPYKLEYQKRFASPFMSIILTLIGVSLSARRVRGGTGLHLLVGAVLGVIYIVATLFSAALTVKSGINPAMAIWLPNVVYLLIGLYIYQKAPK